jgi:hypothetical protein
MPGITPEGRVTQAITKYLKGLGCFFFKVHGHAMQRVGVPDILVCYRGWFVALEVKRPEGGIVSPAQTVCMKEIRENGGFASVVTSVREAEALFTEINATIADRY